MIYATILWLTSTIVLMTPFFSALARSESQSNATTNANSDSTSDTLKPVGFQAEPCC
jgi:hypothetical protein